MSWQHILPAAIVLMAGLVTSADAALVSMVDDRPGVFIDISETGSLLSLDDEDETAIITTIGNTILPAGRVVVANNGGIAFDPPDDDLPGNNVAIPSDEIFGGGQALLPYYDDIGNEIGGVYWQEFSNPPRGGWWASSTLIIQWHNKPYADDPATTRFQLQIFDPPRPYSNFAQFIYEDIEQSVAHGTGGSATIGYQDGGSGNNDAQWSFNTYGAVFNGTALSFIPEPSAVLLLLVGGLAIRRRR